MASSIMRFAFVFFVLGCVMAAGWSGEKEEGTRAAVLAEQCWLPEMCSAWAAHLDRNVDARTGRADTAAVASSASVDVANASSATPCCDADHAVDAVWKRGMHAKVVERSFRRGDSVKTSDR